MTLDLPDDLVQELKLRSVHERRKLKDVAAQAIRRGLRVTDDVSIEATALPEGLVLGEHGLPVFRCRGDSPAKRMTAEELIDLGQQIVAEEDLQRAGLAP